MTNLTPQIMNRVTRLESRRMVATWVMLLVTLLSLASLTIVSFWIAIMVLAELGSFELLTIFSQNREVISNYWWETLAIFWQELPTIDIIHGLVALAVLLVVIYKITKWWPAFKKKWSYLTKAKPKI